MMCRYLILRRGEVFFLPLRNIDLGNRTVSIREVPEAHWVQKNRGEDTLPMTKILWEFLNEDLSKRASNEFWYLDNGLGAQMYWDESQLSKAFKSYCEELKLCNIKPIHAIRAGGITHMIEQGVPLTIVQKLARHASIVTTRGYVNTENLPIQRAVNVLGNDTQLTRDEFIN